MIRFLEHKDIDKTKWDEVIHNSPNGLIFALSWYLDITAPGWAALVKDDYNAVMPLHIKTRFFVKYITQPQFTKPLGVFYSDYPEKINITEFINRIPKSYKIIKTTLNNYPLNDAEDETFQKYTYQYMDLSRPYEELKKNYTKNARKNIKKALASEIKIKTIQQNDYLLFKKKYPRNKSVAKVYPLVKQISITANDHKMAKFYGAFDEMNDLCAAKLILSFNKRNTLLTAATNRIGRDKKANFLLIDQFIKDHCEHDEI
ncbi:MAG: hypothetical protein JXB17_10885, partial [Bacteroidales bacterium]|nr:hypothetical protein [Bacteroidales bacterium]